ncbi:hypothetical protein Tco_0777225 [Tanacetum coccineum]
MANSAWIKAMQEELHQFDRLDVWELVDRPLCKNLRDTASRKESTSKSHLLQLLDWKLSGYLLRELKFSIGIQINQSPHGNFINQAKYAQEILNKHGMTSCDRIGADIAKISRKRLKPDKHVHGNGRARKEPGESYQKSRMVNSSQPLVNLIKKAQKKGIFTLGLLTKETQGVTITDCHAGNPCELEIDLTAKSSSPIIEGMYGQDWKERAET